MLLHSYIALVIAAGVAAIASSLYELYSSPIGYEWFLLAALTLISGSATVRIPTIPATISISEPFVFIAVLLFGPAAGTLIVALDGLIISFWSARTNPEPHRTLFNAAAPAFSCWVGSHLFFLLSGTQPLVYSPLQIGTILFPLLVFATIYFALNTWLVALAISIERHLSPIRIWRDNFTYLSLNYFGGASIAAFFVLVASHLDLSYTGLVTSLLISVPLLLVVYLSFRASMGRVDDARRHLSELNTLYLSTVETLAMAIDAKDQITHGHIRRVQHLALGLAEKVGITNESELKAIEAAALLHDMGKLAVPEYILNKPGKLTPAAFEKMKLHASVGADILSSINFPYPVVPIVRHHHENWDGSGYPDGLKGTEIPIGARILSVVDCFDALISDRPYRPRLSEPEAMQILLERKGTMYDPFIVDVFSRVRSDLESSPIHSYGSRHALSTIADSSQPHTSHVDTQSRLEDISSSSEEMLTLYELAGSLAGRTGLADAADVIATHLKRLIPLSTCAFFVYDADQDELVASRVVGEASSLISGARIPFGQRLTGWVAANRQTIINSDPALDLGSMARSARPRLCSCLSTPLVKDGRLIGALTLYSSRQQAFTDDHKRILEVIAKQVSHLVSLSLKVEESQAVTHRDEPTGLPTLERLHSFYDLVSRSDSSDAPPTSVLLVRVDGMDDLHAQYDEGSVRDLVQALVLSIKGALRGADVMFRYDRSSFAIVLALTPTNVAVGVANRVRGALLKAISQDPRLSRHIGSLIGSATAPDHGKGLPALLQHATATMSELTHRPSSGRLHRSS